MFFSRKYLNIVLFFVFFIVALFSVKGFLHNKVIGMFEHPGLQGDLFFQEHMFSRFKDGKLLTHYKTDFFNYPHGEELNFAVLNSFHLVLYIVLKHFCGIFETYNLSVIIFLFLNFYTAYLLSQYLFRSKLIAFSSAFVFAFNPYIFLKLNMGFIQKIVLMWLPLYLLTFLKYQRSHCKKYIILPVVILCLMQMTYPPYAYYTLVFTAIYYVVSFIDKKEAVSFNKCIGLVSLFVCIMLVIYHFMGYDFGSLSKFANKYDINSKGIHTNLFSIFCFFPYKDIPMKHTAVLPLGMSLLAFLLSLITAIKHKGFPRILFIILLIFLVLSAGPYLTFYGKPLTMFNRKIVLPFYFIAKYLPAASLIAFPIRLFPFINICLALLVGYSLQYISDLIKNKIKVKKNNKVPALYYVAGVFILLYIFEFVILFPGIFPPKISNVKIPKIYKEIRNENFTAVLNLPATLKTRRARNSYALYTILSYKKMMNSYHKRDLDIYLPTGNDSEKEKRHFIKSLAGWKVKYIIVHKNFYKEKGIKEHLEDVSWLKDFCKTTYDQEYNLIIHQVPLSLRDIKENATDRYQ